MNKTRILDASAVLAYLQQEKGQERVEAAFDEGPCRMTTLNICEVLGKLCEKGMPLADAQAAFQDLGVIAVDFDEELAGLAALLRVRTRSIGASLGDRACLALAERTARAPDTAVVYTAEHAWGRLRWSFKVAVIR